MKCVASTALVLFIGAISTVSSLRFSLPEIDENTPASVNAEDTEGGLVNVPRGLFHYSDNEQRVNSRFRIPDFETLDPLRMASDLMGAAANAQNRRKSLGGISLPMPFAAAPMNLQVSSDTRSGVSMSDPKGAESPTAQPMSDEARKAFEVAKRICMQAEEEDASCDEALDTFHRVKFGRSLVSSLPDDPSSSFARMMLPSLQEKLNQLNAKEEATPSPKILTPRGENVRRAPAATPHRDVGLRLPPRYRNPTPESKMRDFLMRIS